MDWHAGESGSKDSSRKPIVKTQAEEAWAPTWCPFLQLYAVGERFAEKGEMGVEEFGAHLCSPPL